MNHTSRARISLLGAFGLAFLLSGCGNDNQDQSRIKGTVPTDSISTEDRMKSMRGGGAPTGSKPYPGAKK